MQHLIYHHKDHCIISRGDTVCSVRKYIYYILVILVQLAWQLLCGFVCVLLHLREWL